MTDQRLTIFIDGREALPVRAIPYVTAWYRFTPDVVAWYLAQDPDRFTEWDLPLAAHYLSGGMTVPVLPREWDTVVARLDGLDAETRTQPDAQGYVLWREQSVQKIPAGAFVWLDEFVPVYMARCLRVQDEDKRPSDLNLSPLLDDSTRVMVMEGFNGQVASDTTSAQRITKSASVVIVASKVHVTAGHSAKTRPARRMSPFDVVFEYLVVTFKAGQYSTAKSFYRALERGAGIDSPLDKGVAENLGSLVVRQIRKPLTLKTVENRLREIRVAAKVD